MNTLAWIVVGGMVLAVLAGAWHAWKHRNDEPFDIGGPYL